MIRRHYIRTNNEAVIARQLRATGELCPSDDRWLECRLHHRDWRDADWVRLREIGSGVGLDIVREQDLNGDDGAWR